MDYGYRLFESQGAVISFDDSKSIQPIQVPLSNERIVHTVRLEMNTIITASSHVHLPGKIIKI